LSTPGEEEDGDSSVKRAKGEDGTPTPAPSQHVPEEKESEEVKEVTQGVNEVELKDGKPEAVPLPASPPPEAQEEGAAEEVKTDDNRKLAISPAKSTKSTSAKDTDVSHASVKSAEQLVAVDISAISDIAAPSKAPRKTRKLPAKSARPSSKVVKKTEKAAESGKTLEEVVGLVQDGRVA
jgi:hypothetical protein